jgi:hypothetical protein
LHEPHHAQIRIRAAHREPEIDMTGWHRKHPLADHKETNLRRERSL